MNSVEQALVPCNLALALAPSTDQQFEFQSLFFALAQPFTFKLCEEAQTPRR